MRVQPETIPVEQVVVDHRRQQPMRGGHGVHIAGQVEVQALERSHLAVPAPGCPTLYPEGGSHGGLADCDRRATTDHLHALTKADGRRRLPFAERCWRDRRHDDVTGPRSISELFDGTQVDLRDEGTVELEQVWPYPHLLGDLLDGLEIDASRDLDRWFDGHIR